MLSNCRRSAHALYVLRRERAPPIVVDMRAVSAVFTGRSRYRCAFVSLALLVAAVVFYCLGPHYALAERVKQLQLLNQRLHDEIATLRRAEGGGSTEDGGIDKRKPSYGDSYDLPEQWTSVRGWRCETIHVGFVAAGYNASRLVATVIKTILFYRHNPLHFHFVSDAPAKHILGTLMNTWQLPAVNFSFYDTEPLRERVSWIPSLHYSGVYGLMKLVVPDVLPLSMEAVIMLDTDIMLNSDIALLWRFFADIKRKRKVLGIVENQSNWYLGNIWENHRPWPAVGRGFNTGVVLLNLGEMRRQGWGQMWSAVARSQSSPAALADQDVVNAVIKEHPHIHLALPCAWNVQLSDNSLSEFCYQNAENFRIVHWNSPKKMNVENNHGAYFRLMYDGFVQYDGNLLRRRLITCHSFEDYVRAPPTITRSKDACFTFRSMAKLQHRTHPFFLGSNTSKPNARSEITLISQLSMDRLHMLEPLCLYWKGPMSISVYASDAEAVKLFDYVTNHWCFRQRNDVAVHVVYAASQVYPVNYLRNVALNHLSTQFAFLLDIDFVPMVDLHDYLLEAVQVLSAEKRALVVPAFETHLYRLDVPRNKAQLLDMVEAGSVQPFRYTEWPQGHAPTNYEHWRSASRPYRVDWAPDFEPYVVLQWPFPRYDTRFVGFGWNKVSHIMELHHAAYEFVVLPGAFVIHVPHSPSPDISNFRSSTLYRDCLQVLKREFKDTLNAKYLS